MSFNGYYKEKTGLGNRMRNSGRKNVRVGNWYDLPVHYLRGEDAGYLRDRGVDLRFKCIGKFKDYAMFENTSGNRMCFRYFDLDVLSRKHGEVSL